MCFYRQLHFNCEHHIQWECLELCITARDSPQPNLCQVRLPVGEALSKHNYICRYCPIDLAAAIDVQLVLNGGNDGSVGDEPRPTPLHPMLVNTGDDDRQYLSQMTGIDMRQCRGRSWGEGRGGIEEATNYHMAQGIHAHGNIGFRDDGPLNSGFEHNRFQYGYQMVGGAGEHPATNSYPTPTPTPSQSQPNHQHRYPSMQSQQKSKNYPMSYPYPPRHTPNNISPQRRLNTKRYELAFRGPQQASLERRYMYTSPAVTTLNSQYRGPPVNSLAGSTAPTRNNTQPTTWSNPLPNSSTDTTSYIKLPNEQDVPYLSYPQEYFTKREASLKSRGVQQLAIIDTLSRVRSSDSPILDLNKSKTLYEETLALETHKYRSDMPHFQARSKVLLKALKDVKDLGDVQFWLKTAEKLKETEGRVDEPLREMEGWMGAVDAFPPWDRHPRRGWCGWVAEAEGHLEGGNGYAGTYVDENGEMPM